MMGQYIQCLKDKYLVSFIFSFFKGLTCSIQRINLLYIINKQIISQNKQSQKFVTFLMSPSITPVIDLHIPNISNASTINSKSEQKKKQIISLLKQIKQFQTKINQLETLKHKQKQKDKYKKQQNTSSNNQIQIKIKKPPSLQLNSSPIIKQEKEQKQISRVEQTNDPIKYQIDMLRQQNNLLKQQNDLLKEQTTLKMKITKSDQLIYHQPSSSSPLINSNALQLNIKTHIQQPSHNNFSIPQPYNNLPISYQQIPSSSVNPIISANYQSQSIPTRQYDSQPKTFVRSNTNPLNFQSNQYSSLQSRVYQNSQHSLPILPQSNIKIIRPLSKRKDAGKILFVKSKYSSEKPQSQIQGNLSPPYSLDNYQFPQQTYPSNQLKRGIQSTPEQIIKKQSSKTFISSEVKPNSASFKKIKITSSKQKLIKQEAFDKVNVMKNSLSERKFSNKKQPHTPSKQRTVLKQEKQFSLKLQSNKQPKRPLRNQKNKQIEEKFVIGENIQLLEFNTEKEKIDFDNLGFSSVFTDKKMLSDKKAPINFHNANLSELNSFNEFLKLAPKIPPVKAPPLFQSTQQELLLLAKQAFPLFNVNTLQSPDTDLNIKKFKNCVFFGINSHHNILWHYDGKLYYGSWKLNQQGQGEKFGQGIQFYPDKYIFQGQFSHGKRNGQGILHIFHSTNQSIYIGQFVNGKKQGRGKIIDQTESIYEGEWFDDKRNGLGFYKYPNGDLYEGIFSKGEKQGFGVQKFKNGDLYRGEYKNDKFEGKGLYIWRNTSQYEGQFKQGRRNGQGIWKSSNKTDAEIYQGEYVNDKKDGYGIYRWHNGSYYQGYFKKDKKHGVGKTRYQNGKIAVLQWSEGVSVRKVDKSEWPEFLMDQNQTTIKSEQRHVLSKPKINTFFQYQQISTYEKNQSISPTAFDFSAEGMGQISESRHESYQSYQNQQTRTHEKTFTGQYLRQAKYQPIGSNLNVFNL